MEPKKVVILVLLLVGLVFAGRWACAQWHHYNPEQTGTPGYGYGYGAKGGKAPDAAPAPVQ